MAKAEHYNKKQERDNINRFLTHLKERRRLSFTEGKNLLGVSSVTMSSYLRQPQDDQRIEHYCEIGKERKKRKGWYRIKPENRAKVEAQIHKYEAIEFIEGISNPVHVYELSKDGTRAIATFVSAPGVPTKALKTIVRSTISGWVKVLKMVKPMKDMKLAAVIMVERKASKSWILR